MLIVSLVCACISIVTLKVSEEDYFAIVTLGVGEMFRLIALNEDWLTGGALGLSGIPRPLANIIPSDIYIYVFLAAYILILFNFHHLYSSLFYSPLFCISPSSKHMDGTLWYIMTNSPLHLQN